MNTLEHINSDKTEASDEALVLLAQNGDTDALTELVCRFLPLIRNRASSFTTVSTDRDDLIQEGLIALLSAVNAYHDDKGAGFKTYCYVCVQNKMLKELEKRSSKKQQAMQNYLPLEELERSTLNDDSDDPFWIVAARESRQILMEKAKNLLSGLEQETLSLYLSGLSYEEIAAQLNLSTKAVDNALQRVRRKLREV